MQTLVWTQQFDTGIDEVDRQHRQLVDIINRLGALATTGHADDKTIESLLGELVDYAFLHFEDEENLMETRGVDRRHIEHHQQQHGQFIEQVTEIWDRRTAEANAAEQLGEFLTTWLASHILDEDQYMARQITLIVSGCVAADAYRQAQRGG